MTTPTDPTEPTDPGVALRDALAVALAGDWMPADWALAYEDADAALAVFADWLRTNYEACRLVGYTTAHQRAGTTDWTRAHRALSALADLIDATVERDDAPVAAGSTPAASTAGPANPPPPAGPAD